MRGSFILGRCLFNEQYENDLKSYNLVRCHSWMMTSKALKTFAQLLKVCLAVQNIKSVTKTTDTKYDIYEQ